MARAGLKHWMLHNDQLAHELDETLKLSPGYDPVRDVDPALTFHAPLLTGPDSIPGAIRATVERNSEATYQAPRGAFLLSAPDNESRHEYTPDDQPLGVLMEPASTNKCENYNANPDAALTGIDHQLDGEVRREFLPEEIREAGLSAVCDSGYLFVIDNRAGPGNCLCYIDGITGNQNPHTSSVYTKVIEGRGEFGLSAGTNMLDFSNEKWARLEVFDATPVNTNQRVYLLAPSGSLIYFALNQLEESEVISNVMITKGAVTSRAVDQISWPLIDSQGRSILSQVEGMHAVIWRPSFAADVVVAAETQRIISMATALFYFHNLDVNGVFKARSGASTEIHVDLPTPLAIQDYVIALWWNGTDWQLGMKTNGAWIWSDVATNFAGITENGFLLLGDFIDGNVIGPVHCRKLCLWAESRGADWLMTYFEKDAT